MVGMINDVCLFRRLALSRHTLRVLDAFSVQWHQR
jgi:hypothetical protein